MAEPTINEYCPPPAPEDYLEGEIQYPTPEGKEWQDSRNPTANDLLIEPDKQSKVVISEGNISNASNLGVAKEAVRLPSRLEVKSRKRFNRVGVSVSSNKVYNSLVLSNISVKKRNNLI
jgi:hypothetical protein